MTPVHHEERLCAWAEKTGRPVLSIDYGKAPECECCILRHPYRPCPRPPIRIFASGMGSAEVPQPTGGSCSMENICMVFD